MTRERPDPVRPADDEARALAARLLAEARHAVLGVNLPGRPPLLSRIALCRLPGAGLISLISGLAQHHAALRAEQACSLLLGEAPGKGDPLAFPRLSLSARAEFLPDKPAPLREAWLAANPKAALYIGFADFCFVRFHPDGGFLNGGFGRAYRMEAGDLA